MPQTHKKTRSSHGAWARNTHAGQACITRWWGLPRERWPPVPAAAAAERGDHGSILLSLCCLWFVVGGSERGRDRASAAAEAAKQRSTFEWAVVKVVREEGKSE